MVFKVILIHATCFYVEDKLNLLAGYYLLGSLLLLMK